MPPHPALILRAHPAHGILNRLHVEAVNIAVAVEVRGRFSRAEVGVISPNRFLHGLYMFA